MTKSKSKRQSALLAALILGVAVFVLPTPVLAACDTGRILPPCVCTGDCSVRDFVLMFVNLANFFLWLVALFAVFYIVNGAFTWIVSGGDPEKINIGKKAVTGALVGLVLVLAAWAVINTLFFTLSGSTEVDGQKWWQLWKAPPEQPEVPTYEPGGAGDASCADDQALAESYNVPYPADESPSLERLVTCIRNNVPDGLIDTNQIFTVEENNPRCNYTRGYEICGDCVHRVKSCHYGGAYGTEGAMGVDFNAAAGHTEQELNQAIEQALNGPCTGMAGYRALENGNHTHISTIDCSGS